MDYREPVSGSVCASASPERVELSLMRELVKLRYRKEGARAAQVWRSLASAATGRREASPAEPSLRKEGAVDATFLRNVPKAPPRETPAAELTSATFTKY